MRMITARVSAREVNAWTRRMIEVIVESKCEMFDRWDAANGK
jgi:hypothetical protein